VSVDGAAAGLNKLVMPKWGLSMSEGRFIGWIAEEGVDVALGDGLAEVETDKIDGVVEATSAGTLLRRLAQPGETIPVGAPIGVIGPADADPAVVDAWAAELQASFVPADGGDSGPQTEALTVDGRRIRYLRLGEGPQTVVLLHGFGGDLGNWLFNQEPLAGEERTVIALDLPGHGESSKDVGAADLDFLATSVAAFLDALGIERAHLVGHSLGGAVATQVALSRPGLVASLALIAPGGLGEEIDGEYIDGFVTAESRRELKPLLERLFADADLVTRRLVDDVLRMKRIDGVTEALGAIGAAVFPGGRQARVLAAELSAADVPVLVVWGTADRIVPAAQAAAAPARARVELLEGTGHSPHMERAGDVNRLLAEFIDSAGGS
jgi:pyruvate dehydrogenase E2 component (dihydrolipoamide acetyltransferase)